MKKRKVLKWTLIILLSLALVYTGVQLLLSFFGLAFTHYITYSFIAIEYLLAVALAIQAIVYLFLYASKSKKILRLIYIFGGTITSICLAVALYGTIIFSTFRYEPVHVVEKNGETMVVYVDGYTRGELRYYNYKNIFVRGKQIKIREECRSEGYDPFKDGGTPSIDNAVYYDDAGKVIQILKNQ